VSTLEGSGAPRRDRQAGPRDHRPDPWLDIRGPRHGQQLLVGHPEIPTTTCGSPARGGRLLLTVIVDVPDYRRCANRPVPGECAGIHPTYDVAGIACGQAQANAGSYSAAGTVQDTSPACQADQDPTDPNEIRSLLGLQATS
jgi:hypothetical protein